MRTYVDHKLAASGEHVEDAQVPLWPVQSLLEALKPSKTTQTTQHNFKPAVQPPMAFVPIDIMEPIVGQIRKVEQIYDNGKELLKPIFEIEYKPWKLGMNKSLQDHREIVVEFGRSHPGDGLSMAMGVVHAEKLKKEPIEQPLKLRSTAVMDKLHQRVYKLPIMRTELLTSEDETFHGVMLEVGFYSKLQSDSLMANGSEEKVYLGKTKIFFPRPHTGMVMYLDLSKI